MTSNGGKRGVSKKDTSEAVLETNITAALIVVGIVLVQTVNDVAMCIGIFVLMYALMIGFSAFSTAIEEAVERKGTRSAIVSWIFVPVVLVIFVLSLGAGYGISSILPADYPEKLCKTTTIPFDKTETGDRSSPNGYASEVTTTGVDGKTVTCRATRSSHPDKVTTTDPVTEVTIYTAKPAPTPVYYQPSYNSTYSKPSTGYRQGAFCRDGSYSYATGRGACSHHGGVDEWDD